MTASHRKCIEQLSQVERRAQDLDLRRQRQIANQVASINRLLDNADATGEIERLSGLLADAEQDILAIHTSVNVMVVSVVHPKGDVKVQCGECGKDWPCATVRVFGIGSEPGSTEESHAANPA